MRLILIALTLQFAAQALLISEDKPFRVRIDKISEHVYDFYADNDNNCPYQFQLSLKDPTITSNLDEFPYYGVIQAKEKNKFLFQLITNRQLEKIPEFRQVLCLGDPQAIKPDHRYVYYFPFNEGESYRVTQYYNGTYSHKGWLKYSIDFGMNVGTPVCAARGGIVVAVKDSSGRGGPSRRYRGLTNFITIYHDDGTFGQYLHIKKNGSKVKVGDTVKAGDFIAESGNTGWTKGPHLHFMVVNPVKLGYETIKTHFLTEAGVTDQLKLRDFYTSSRKPSDTYAADQVTSLDTTSDTVELGGY